MANKRRRKEVDVTSQYIRGNNSFHINDIKLTEKQRELVKLFKQDCKVMFIEGPAGTAKTFISIFAGLLALRDGRAEKIKYLRALVESCQSKMGFLPGDVDSKTSPFCLALDDKLEELLNAADSQRLVKEGLIQSIPPNFLRGVTFKNSFVIIDEAQEFCYKDLVTIISRIGEGSTLVFCYDPVQADIRNSGILQMAGKFDDDESAMNGIYRFWFSEDDIMRSEILKFIMKKLK